MQFSEELRILLEKQEIETLGDQFGGPASAGRSKSYSIKSIIDLFLSRPWGPHQETDLEAAAENLSTDIEAGILSRVAGGLIRFSFLIELTNRKVGSTKMKTRWLPASIPSSIGGTFAPGHDPRAATFEDCASVFAWAATLVCDEYRRNESFRSMLKYLRYSRVPYEFPVTYIDPAREPVHEYGNVRLADLSLFSRVLEVRRLLATEIDHEDRRIVSGIETSALKTKVFKTDRSQTGKDKTNRAKRWEVLYGDFQYATLEQCWAAELTLALLLVCFDGFPALIRKRFEQAALVDRDSPIPCCPITLEPLSYISLAQAARRHGFSAFQIGHLIPLKRGGLHDGNNICWQSADGNRIQGDLTVDETRALLMKIVERRLASQPENNSTE